MEPARAQKLAGDGRRHGRLLAGDRWRGARETQLIDPYASVSNGSMPPITGVTVQLGAALAERGVLLAGDLADFLATRADDRKARLWQIARSEASDTLTLAAGFRRALEAGLAENLPGWDAVLDRSARDDLADFSSHL